MENLGAGAERFACSRCGVAASGGKFCQECGGPIVAAEEAPPVDPAGGVLAWAAIGQSSPPRA